MARDQQTFSVRTAHMLPQPQQHADDAGSIGKRYRREDEIGTPLCITVDFETVGDENPPADNCVTVRDRDTMEQVRIPISELKDYIEKKCYF